VVEPVVDDPLDDMTDGVSPDPSRLVIGAVGHLLRQPHDKVL
jgi:hypothetical protein